MGTLQYRSDASRQRDVIVLDKHAVRKIKPVILSAAATHRVLVENTQAGHGLAGIEYAGFRSRDGVHKLSGERGDSAKALQKIQDYALTGKNDPRVVPDHGNRLAVMQSHPIEHFGMTRDLVVRGNGAVERGVHIENPRHAAYP